MKTKAKVLIAFLVLLGANLTANAQWSLTGNSGTNPAIHFIGTTDSETLIFKVNNVFSGVINSNLTSYGFNSMSTGHSQNSAFGALALKNSNVNAGFNSAFGYAALTNTISGGANTAVGHTSMYLNTTGQNNTAMGFESLYNNNGGQNVALGMRTLFSNTTGAENVAVGYNALKSNTVGVSNVAVGANTLVNSTGQGNTAIGRGSGNIITSGSFNSFMGYDSAKNLTSGSNNTFIGMNSGSDFVSGNSNSFFGSSSGRGITTGTGNTFLGNVWMPNTPATAISAGNNTGNTVILADGTGNQKIYFHSNGFTGIGLGNNAIPNSTLEIRSIGGSPSLSGLRFTNLTNTSASITNTTNKVLSVNVTGDVILVDDKQGTGGAITNALTSSSNTMTSNVNGTVATAPIVNSVTNTIASGQLTTTVNGVASTPVTLPSGGVDTDAQTLGVSGDQLTISNGNTVTLPSLTEVDGSTTNELSNLLLTGNVLTLTNPLTPGNSVTLPSLTEIDGDVTNELQTLGLNGNVLSISNGNTVTLPAHTDTDAQTLLLTGNVLSISNGNSVILPTGTGGGPDVSIYTNDGVINTTTIPSATPGVRTVTMGNNNLFFKTTNSTSGNGRVYIGDTTLFPAITTTSKYRLLVEGGILTEKVKVAVRSTANWADYVFANDYKLMPLTEVESFIKTNKHLPGVSSAENLVNEGLDLGEMQAKQMQKIEELTLYAIEQNKTIEKQSKEIEELKVLVNALVNKNK